MTGLRQCAQQGDDLMRVKATSIIKALEQLDSKDVVELPLGQLARHVERKAAEARANREPNLNPWEQVVHDLKVLRSHVPYAGLRFDEGDLLTNDLDPDVLSLSVAPALDIAYLAQQAEGKPEGVVAGIFFGHSRRPMLALTGEVKCQ
jgi:hypothetical protein